MASRETRPVTRRGFLKGVVTTAIATPLIGFGHTAFASDLPELSEDDPQAQALGYKADTADVDGAKFPNHSVDQKCLNCQLWQGGDEGLGPCAIFPGKGVQAEGWCSAWVKKAG
ncbi:MAG: high-potential iron-sulfur protein [Xanthomonadales bacterium]|nr:high-potential iron-sulfur protein [Xanthomonadales bacterium]